MGKELTIIIFFLWSLQALRQALNWVYWWQVKEYRFDRFRLLLESKEGKKNLEINLIITKFTCLLLALFLGIYYPALLLFTWLNLKLIREVFLRQLRKPIFTLRAIELFLTTLFGMFLIVFLSYQSGIIASNLAFGEILLVGLPVVGILWSRPLVERSKTKVINKAMYRLSIVKPIVIGVTGSYGKTTTKDFIASLLSQKYQVEKTPTSQNTPVGVARKTANLSRDTKIFVVEMGAYKKGEIKTVADIVKPQIGVITGIEPPHLALFCSLQNIKEAKYELIQALPKNGQAIFNGNNTDCLEMLEWARRDGREVFVCQVLDRDNQKRKADLRLKIEKISLTGSTITVHYGRIKKTMETLIPSPHLLQNLGAAILVAKKLGVNWQQIEKGVKTLDLSGRAMRTQNLPSKGILVDDSYNSTPHAFVAALDHLKMFKKRRIVFMTGIIELGKTTYQVHEELGKKLGQIADEIILTNSDAKEGILAGLGDNSKKLVVVTNPNRLAEKIKYYLRLDCAILLEGRMPASVNKAVQKETEREKQ